MITIGVFIIPFLLFLIIFFVFGFFNIFHVIKFGTGDLALYIATFFFIAGSILILFITYQKMMTIDWTTPLIDLQTNTIPTF